ncbi:MAG: precorrin-3B C(17)-methyltransferase, partial [Clostridiales bacterium]
APLSHYFQVISLSDLLSPCDLIEKRLLAAAAADFVIVLYNPASQKRREHLAKACALIGQYQAPETVCGYVQNIGRVGEKAVTTTLAQLAQTTVDMFTTVFIGNSQTQELGGKMVTPRGYIYG